VSNSEVLNIVLLGVVALQMFLTRHLLVDSMRTMRACSETSDMAFELALRVLDGEMTADIATEAAPQEGSTP
jgi:hypothetical protein